MPKQTEVLQTRLEYFFLTDIISNSTSGTARDFEEPHFSLTESLKVRELLKEGTVVMLSGCRVSLGEMIFAVNLALSQLRSRLSAQAMNGGVDCYFFNLVFTFASRII